MSNSPSNRKARVLIDRDYARKAKILFTCPTSKKNDSGIEKIRLGQTTVISHTQKGLGAEARPGNFQLLQDKMFKFNSLFSKNTGL